MNKLANEIPNRIKQPSQCCINCGKSYIKRVNLDKHLVICELLQKSRKTSKIIIEEDEPMPSQRKMFEMLIELGQKYSRLEEKVDEINKWVVKKKKKINVLEWLNANIKPDINFDNIIDKIVIDDQDVKYLLDNTFYDVLNEVFSRTIYNFNETQNPIFAFVQKQNVFYIYDKDNVWIELSRERLIKFLNKVHTKIFKQFYEWKKTKTSDIKSDDKLATQCDKTLVKITSVEFNQESILSKVKNNLFSIMKTDMKALVEYEFEF
jgi:uncharacterized protein YeeX (DUF496 family)